MHLQAKHRKFIINDFKLPKIVTESPYFETQFSLLRDYNFEYVFDFVLRCIDDFKGKPDLFFDEVNQLSHELFEYVRSTYNDPRKYTCMVSTERYHNTTATYRSTLINPDAADKRYIRVDIKHACFNVLKELTFELDEFVTYSSLVHSFESYDEPVRDYVASSKRIRSYIFGSVQKQLIIHLEKHIISDIMDLIDSNDVAFKDCDEVTYHYSDELYEKVNSVIANYSLRKILRIDDFSLKSLDNGYIEVYDDNILFRGVPAHHFCEEYAKYYGHSVVEDYRVFNFENIPCMRLST